MATGDMFILRNKEIVIPESIETNTTLIEVKNVLNELFSMSFLDLDPATNNFSSHPSYRDFMAFLFQPQNIVANADVLFYKADTTEHRQKLINIFPYGFAANMLRSRMKCIWPIRKATERCVTLRTI